MRSIIRLIGVTAAALSLIVPVTPALAGHETDPRTDNLVPEGHIEEPAILGGFGGASPDIHTDIAFWGDLAIQGNWDGFNIRDISNPDAPTQVSRTFCEGDQGDVTVWGNVITRSWNTPAPGTTECDGQPVPEGFEGLHVFDASNLADPVLVASVSLRCGSHTATPVPDLENNRLLIYSAGSNDDCPGIDIVEVPLDNPAGANRLRFEFSNEHHHCHDTAVILGDVMKAACAGGTGFTVWSLGGPSRATLTNPRHLFSVDVPTVTIGHSAGFTWDGEVLIFGHEPGGGVAAECEATDDPLKRTYFFYDANTGAPLGQWTMTRTQSATENCSLHNFNVVPVSGRHVLVHGSYQAGTGVVDFTDPANAEEIAWTDPPPRPVPPGTPFCCDVGGVWSSYWYNDNIYETNINEGLNIYSLTEGTVDGAVSLDHLNPNTQEFTLP